MTLYHLWAQNDLLPPPKKFFWKSIAIILIYILAPLIVQNFKKVLPADAEL